MHEHKHTYHNQSFVLHRVSSCVVFLPMDHCILSENVVFIVVTDVVDPINNQRMPNETGSQSSDLDASESRPKHRALVYTIKIIKIKSWDKG